MGLVDCWPMQCPPMLPTGAAGCANLTSFADYNSPIADCCAPRCDSKASFLASSVTPTTTTVTGSEDPCLQQLGEPHHKNVDDDDDDDDSKNNNNTLPLAASKPCFYEGRAYQSGARWNDPVDMCTSCDCKVKKTQIINTSYVKYYIALIIF